MLAEYAALVAKVDAFTRAAFEAGRADMACRRGCSSCCEVSLTVNHVEAAALPMGGLTAWQALFVHGRLARGERVLVTGASGGVGHIAVQLARHAGAEVVESGPADLVFDTRGGELPAGERVVTIAEEMPGATYFIVEPDHEQLLELGALVDAGELRAEVDSVFPLPEGRAAFERVAARGKRGKVVLEVGSG